MSMADKIKERRIALGYTQEELASKIGLQKSAIAKYENGRVKNLKRSKILELAKALQCEPSYLLDFDIPAPTARGVRIPVLGSVPCGIPIEAVEEVLDWEEIPEDMARKGEHYGLRVKGNSMSPRIQEGDVLIVRVQPDAENGDIVIAKVNGSDACCKRFIRYEEGIALHSFNPAYDPMVFTKEDIERLPVSILGKVVENRQKF